MKKTIILIFLSLISYKSYSCSCLKPPSVETAWSEADEVFTGKIMRVDTSIYGNYGAKIFAYTIEIIKSFKKDFYTERKLRTILAESDASCDFMFGLGKTYLIYAREESFTLTCSLCSRTDNIENIGNNELSRLERLQKTYDHTDFVESSNNNSYQIDLLKKSFQEKVNSKNRLIYLLSVGFFLLTVAIIIIIKRKDCH